MGMIPTEWVEDYKAAKPVYMARKDKRMLHYKGPLYPSAAVWDDSRMSCHR